MATKTAKKTTRKAAGKTAKAAAKKTVKKAAKKTAAKKTAASAKTEELLTAAKIAQKLGVKPAEVKKAIAAGGLAPDVKRGACAYYKPATVKKIQKALKG